MAIENFIPEIWSANLMVALQKTAVFAALANRDYEGDIAQSGDTVHITSLNSITVGDYKAHADISIEALGDTEQSLVIDQSKYFAFEADDIEKKQAAGEFVSTAMQNAAYELADVEDIFLSTTMAAAASTKLDAVSSADPGDAYATLVRLGAALSKKNVPSQGRWVVVNPDVYGMLQLDPRFVNSSEAANATLHNGVIGAAAGFSVSVSNNLPTTGGAVTLIAGSTLATTFAEQINNVEATRKEKGFADIVKGLHLYGAKVVRPDALATVNYSTIAAAPSEG